MAPDRVPTLTEVVAWPPADAGQAEAEMSARLDLREETSEAATVSAPERQFSEADLTRQILTDVQRQIDLMLEYRLREALAPLLARATDSLVRESRNELASTMRDVVARAVAQELSRHRNR